MSVVITGSVGGGFVPADFISRARRVSLIFPAVFDHDHGTAAGKTVDMSESGVLVNFKTAVEVWTTGELSIVGHGWRLQLTARVARVNGLQAAFAFRDLDESGRAIIRDLVTKLSG
jgi:PilZ domain